MSTDAEEIKVQVEGYQNEAFEGDIQNGSAVVFEDVDLKEKQNGNNKEQESGPSLPTTNNNVKPTDTNGDIETAKNGKTKEEKAEMPVVFVSARRIEVRHESQNSVRTSSQGIDNPAYEEDWSKRTPEAGYDGDYKDNEEGGFCNCRCCLLVLLIFVLLALVAVVLIFLLLPKNQQSEVEVVVVLDVQFIPEYDDPLSSQYQKLESDYKNAMDKVFLMSNKKNQYNGIEITKFSPGSVRVDSIVKWILKASLLDQSKINNQADTEVGITVMEAIMTDNRLGDLPVFDVWVITEDPSVPPVITCSGDIRQETQPGFGDAEVTWNSPMVLDNSGVVSLMSNYQSGSTFPIGRSEVIYTARDPSGNRVKCNFTIDVIDAEMPNITCPADVGPVATDPGFPVREVTWEYPSATDNSGEVNVVRTDGNGGYNKLRAVIGETIISYAAIDPSANVGNCSFIITVIDTEPPQVICPQNIYLVPNQGAETAQIGVLWENPGITDNSRIVITNITSTATPTTEFFLGLTVVTMTAADPSGNVGTCSFSVTVEEADVIPPEIQCPQDITTYTFGGATSRPIRWDQPKVSDNSGRDVSLVSNAMSSIFPIGISVVTYTATDFSGNSAMCSFTVTVQDLQPPYIDCPDDVMDRLPDSKFIVSISVSWNSPYVEDNSGGNVSVNVSHQPGSLFGAGVTWVTYTARDPYNNEGSCDFKVIVEDPKCGPPYTILETDEVYSINSTNYPERYNSYTECTWILVVPGETVAVVTIKDFHTENNFDFVTIGGSTSDRDPPVGNNVSRFEGDLNPTRFLLNDSTVWMTFFADRGTTYTGFWIEIIAVSPEDISSCVADEYLLVRSELCNGLVDCPDSSDETICICSEGQFQCDHGICIPSNITCDDVNDCGDYSDERYCPPCTDDIELKCAQLLPYTDTFYPNPTVMNSEAASSLLQNTYVSAILDTCHAKAYLVVCATIYPECPHFGPQRGPCTTLCREVSQACADIYENMVGSPWPVNCGEYPLDNGEDFCEKIEGDFFNTGICGTRLPGVRIIGGEPSDLGDWPWIASLRDPESSTKHKCGGSLIGDQWVLTVAHCVGHFNEIYLGDLFITDTSPNEEMIEVADAFPHPDYDILTNEYDFAVVQLSRPVNFTDYIRPICLATSQTELSTYHTCYIAGWGTLTYDGQHSDNLQDAPVPLISREQCADYYSNRALYTITEKMVCAGYEEGRVDACQGDSGGPLMCLASDNRWHIVGITSFGDGCAQAKSPGVYTRVSQLESFISGVIQQVEDCFANGGYICNNNKCIAQEQVCDYKFNCAGGDDETNCHHICANEALIPLDINSLIQIRLVNFSDAVHIYCLWAFEAPPAYRIVLRAKQYYTFHYQVEIGEGIDPGNATSVVRKLPRYSLDLIPHFSVTSSKMWVTLSRQGLISHPLELDTMYDVFIVPEVDVIPCDVRGEVVFKSAVCDGTNDCTDESDEKNCNR